MLRVAREVGLPEAIDGRLHWLQRHVPDHESDHVLNLALNAWCDATCRQDWELRRNDEVFLDAVGADSTPDPTTAGDFCRRFGAADLDDLRRASDDARLHVGRRQAPEFFAEAIIDMDGTLVVTTGECKGGMDISYKGDWGDHPLVVTLATTGELLNLVNRAGNRPREEGAAAAADRAIAVCRAGGCPRVRLRGDAAPNLVQIADELPESAWKKLTRPPAHTRTGPRRARPDNVQRQVIRRREFLHLELKSEQVAEFSYQPTACAQPYRMVVVRKNISPEKGEKMWLDQVRYFFYLTNDRPAAPRDIVFGCHDRCDQEHLLAQLAGGVRAWTAPVDNLLSNGAYLLLTSLAWTLKAWAALLLPVEPRHRAEHQHERRVWLRMEFKTFVNAVLPVPCQIVRSARRSIFRVLNWNPHLPAFFRLCRVLRC